MNKVLENILRTLMVFIVLGLFIYSSLIISPLVEKNVLYFLLYIPLFVIAMLLVSITIKREEVKKGEKKS